MVSTDIKSLTEQEKKKMLQDVIMNDVSYWQKILILMQMEDRQELLEQVIKNKRMEIDLLNGNINAKNFDFEELKYREISKVKEEFLKEDRISNVYSKACKEVLEILNYIPERFYKEIEEGLLAKIQNSADINYEFSIEQSENLSNIELLEETKDILALIIKEVENSQKAKKQVQVQDEIKEIFEKESEEKNSLCEYKPKWYERLFSKFARR